MKIQAIVINGFHEGHVLFMEYSPTIQLLKPRSIRVDYCCDNSEYPINELPETEKYKACFRSLDGRVVLYSTKGESEDLTQGSFARSFSDKPWIKNTTLYFGYHNEQVRREDVAPQEEFLH